MAASALLDISCFNMGCVLDGDGSATFLWPATDQYGYVGACVYFVWLSIGIWRYSASFIKRKSVAVFLFVLFWGVVGLYIDAGYRGYVLIPAQEAMGLDNILPRTACFLLPVYDHFCSKPHDYKVF